jgi:general secretion pathway protein N
MPSIARYTIFALVAYLVFLIATIPADRVYSLAQAKLPFALTADNIDGSVWAGDASQVRVAGELIQRLEWRWFPWTLFLGRVEYGLFLSDGSNRMRGRIGYGLSGNVSFNNLSMDAPIDKFQRFMDLGRFSIDGRLVAKVSTAQIVNGRLRNAEGNLEWRNGAVKAPQTVSLGSFTMAVSTVDDNVQAKVSSAENSALVVDGIVVLEPDGSYRFTGAFTPRDPNDRVLVQALSLMGQQGADGKFNVNFTGKMPLLQ